MPTLYVATAGVTVSNVTGQQTLIGSGNGTLTLPANFLTAGKSLRVRAAGVYGTQLVPVNLRLRLKLGATVILDTGAQTPAGNMAARLWQIDALISCRSVGAGGTVIGQAAFAHMATAGATGSPTWWEMSNAGTVGVNTTGSLVLDLTAEWAAGVAAADTITCTNFLLEVLQ